MRRMLARLGLVPPVSSGVCRCGHPEDWHRHLHDRGYCGTCGPDVCGRFRDEVAR